MQLEELIKPLSLDTFINQYKGEKYFLSKANAKDLFSWSDLNQALFSQRLAYPRFRVIKDGKVLDPDVYTDMAVDRRSISYPKINAQKLTEELKKGSAIHILNAEEFSRKLSEICLSLGTTLKSDVGITIHIGMKESKGFDKHWDSHDVFVVQLEGKKKWRLYGFTEKYPFRKGPSKKENIHNNLEWEGDLSPGDVLYLPRGCWHEAQAYDQACMHLSIGMFNPKATDYLNWLSTQLIEFEFFRKDAPISNSSEEFINELKSKLLEYINVTNYEIFMNRISQKNHINAFELPNLNL